MNLYGGVDCGGTHLRVGVFNDSGQLLANHTDNSPLKLKPSDFAKIVMDNLDNLSHHQALRAIGVGTPGPLDLEKGLILPSANLGNTNPINLRVQFDRLFNSKVYFDRDTNLALIGEAWQGVAKGLKDVVMLTLGTGVGGAIMIDGKVDHGATGKAGELGHMYIGLPSDRSGSCRALPPLDVLPFDCRSGCGHSVGVPRARHPSLLPATPRESTVVPTCGLGHEGCFEALINAAEDLEEFSTILGYGLANIADIFNPEMIIIGGGKVHLGDFLPKAIEVMWAVAIKSELDNLKVCYAKLGDLSGVYGGAKLAIDGH